MPAVTIIPADLAPFAEIETNKAEEMITDAVARAALVAPCILEADFAHAGAAKAIIRGAIIRWHESGSGALSQEAIAKGPFSHSQTVDTRSPHKGLFSPDEIDELKSLCGTTGGGAFSIDTAPGGGAIIHTASCDLYFGGSDCSCGAILTGGLPLWGT